MYIVDQIKQEVPDFFSSTDTQSTTSGTQEYSLSTDFESMQMVNIQIDGTWRRVEPMGDADFRFVPVLQRQTNSGFSWGEPKYYLRGDYIGFMPIPDETTSNNIKLWYTYTPTELSTDSDRPAIPAKFHHLLKYAAYANYLDQDDEHVAAERMRQRYDRRVAEMVESLAHRQTQSVQSVEITSNQDFYDRTIQTV
jgi:hypothetical protein